MSTSTVTMTEPEAQAKLPKLSAADFKAYNKQADMMQYYHNHFRQTWLVLYKACETNTRPAHMSLRQFTNLGLQLVRQLTTHHDIEESYIFPVLARRMPEFSHDKADTNPNARLMVQQHKQIHDGLDRLDKYLTETRNGERDFRLQGDEGSLKEVMESFGEVLWLHLDEEVRLLGAENMRLYWSKEEVLAMNW